MDRQLKLLTVVVMMMGLIALGGGSALGAVHCASPTLPAVTSCLCGDTHTGPRAIQDAIDHAALGDTVCVGSGTYDEQVTITQSLTLQGNGWEETIIRPSQVSANTTHLDTNDPIAAIVLVDGAAPVTVRDLTIDGDPAGRAFSCAPGFVGLFYRASSGSIDTTFVTDIVHPSNLGCQLALGMLVQTDADGQGPNARVTILNSGAANYGKNGITANGPGTNVAVQRTTAAGLGAVFGVAAQNGVQIGFGARGRVTDSFIVLNNSPFDDVLSCGVLFIDARGGTGPVATNTFIGNEQDVCSASSSSSLQSPSD
jgi:hypothetical protein